MNSGHLTGMCDGQRHSKSLCYCSLSIASILEIDLFPNQRAAFQINLNLLSKGYMICLFWRTVTVLIELARITNSLRWLS